MSFSIDGMTWEYPCKIEREAQVTPSEISGLMLDKSYFNDVLGTYMKYSLTLAVPFDRESDYYAIYETLTEPVDGHTFVFPYNATTIEIVGRVSNVSDAWVLMPNGNFWRGTQFEIAANHPSKTLEYGEVVSRGRFPSPGVPWSGWVKFYVDDDGYLHLIKTDSVDMDFYIDDDGNLHSVAFGDVMQFTTYGWDRVLVEDGETIYY